MTRYSPDTVAARDHESQIVAAKPCGPIPILLRNSRRGPAQCQAKATMARATARGRPDDAPSKASAPPAASNNPRGGHGLPGPRKPRTAGAGDCHGAPPNKPAAAPASFPGAGPACAASSVSQPSHRPSSDFLAHSSRGTRENNAAAVHSETETALIKIWCHRSHKPFQPARPARRASLYAVPCPGNPKSVNDPWG